MKSMAAPSLKPLVDWDRKESSLKPVKKPGSPLFLVLGLVLLVLIASALYRASHEAPVEKMIPVVTTIRDTPPGTRLGLMHLHLMPVPARFVNPDMVTSLNYAADSVTRTYIGQGEPIDRRQLFPRDGSLATTLETHERAMTLQMSEEGLIDHCINPDDRVDVICVSSNKEGKRFTRTIATDARVLMCVQKEQLLARRIGNSSANMVTLALTPDLVETVSEAAEVGKLRLVLRNRLTRLEPRLKGASPDDLLPAKAFVEDKKLQMAAPSPVAVPAIPGPPMINMSDSVFPAPPAVQAAPPVGPVQWIVEMFSGSHKESYGVPTH